MGIRDLRRKFITDRIMCWVSARAARLGCLLGGLLIMMAPTILAEHLPIKTYTIADGLGHDVINRIIRDSHGYLWFCTREGLSRFDGYTFTNYARAQGLPGREVNDLLETRDGVYWVATDAGVYRFNPTGGRLGNADFGLGISDSPIPQSAIRNPQSTEPMFLAYYLNGEQKPYDATALLEDHAGVIWCGTNVGVYQLARSDAESTFRFVDMGMPMDFEGPFVQTLLEDRQGTLWFGTIGSGLYRHLSDGHTDRYTAQHGLLSNDVRALLEDRQGHLWAGTRTGLCLLVPNPKANQPIVARAFARKDGLAADQVFSLFQSADGPLWLGMFGGLSSFVPGGDASTSQISSFTTRNGLTDLAVWAIAEDREGNLWLASNGALKLAREGFTTYREEDGLGTNRIASIFANQKGQVCAVSSGMTKKFINQFDGKKFTAVAPNLPKQTKEASGWGWNQITFQDHTGEWWVATGEGLFRFPKVGRLEQLARTPPKAVYHALGDMPVDEVFRLYEDARGDIWISASSNPPHPAKHWLSRWERTTETFHNYTPADGLPLADNWLPLTTAFREDRAGNVWIGFNGAGLARFHDGRFTVFTTKDGLPAGWIYDLYLDHAGRLWIASNRQGVSRIDDPAAEEPSFINYTTDKGLASDSVWCITEDRWNRIYVGTGRGVDRLDPESGHIRHYTQADGLAQNELQVAFRDEHGSLWFGTAQGLSRLDPQPDEGPKSLPILISGLHVNGVAQHISELGETEISKLVLGPYQNQIQIDFVGLDFGTRRELRYQYKLEGSDRDWSAPTAVRTVNYASLRSGSYRFLVRAVSADGVFSPTPATVAFSILPPVWQRWWFLTLVVLVACLAGYQIYRYRVARLLELERVRTRIATDLHDDIGSSLSQVSVLSEVVNRRVGREPSVSEPLAMIANLSRDLVDSMNDIVWAINPKRDRLSDLTQRMRRFASDAFTVRDIEFSFSAPDAEHDTRLGADMRREIFLIFKESVNNVVRHSGCNEARIDSSIQHGALELRVYDNGRGFDPEIASDGNGLASMRQRAHRIGGALDICSQGEQGTTVSLKAPLDGHHWIWRGRKPRG